MIEIELLFGKKIDVNLIGTLVSKSLYVTEEKYE